jgi:hypothetical protein
VDQQAQEVEVRRRRSRAEAEQLVAECETSGLSQIEFCRKQGVSLATLARYRKRRAQGAVIPGDRWVAVEVSASHPRLEIGAGSGLVVALPSGRRIEVGCGFDARTLAQLLVELERH